MGCGLKRRELLKNTKLNLPNDSCSFFSFFSFFLRQNGKRPSRNLLHLEIPDVQLQISKTIYRLDKQIPLIPLQKRNDNQNS